MQFFGMFAMYMFYNNYDITAACGTPAKIGFTSEISTPFLSWNVLCVICKFCDFLFYSEACQFYIRPCCHTLLKLIIYRTWARCIRIWCWCMSWWSLLVLLFVILLHDIPQIHIAPLALWFSCRIFLLAGSIWFFVSRFGEQHDYWIFLLWWELFLCG